MINLISNTCDGSAHVALSVLAGITVTSIACGMFIWRRIKARPPEAKDVAEYIAVDRVADFPIRSAARR